MGKLRETCRRLGIGKVLLLGALALLGILLLCLLPRWVLCAAFALLLLILLIKLCCQ